MPAPLHLSSVYGVAHSALAKRPNPRRAARRSHRLLNCVKANSFGVRAAGLCALVRFFAVETHFARAGSAASLLAVAAIAVCVVAGPSAGTRYCSKTQPRSPEVGSVIWTQPVSADLQWRAGGIEAQCWGGNRGVAVHLSG